MSARDDGGPAFPTSIRRTERYMDECGYGRERTVTVDQPGITLRDYFIAHAPAEPQDWFKPVISEPAPKRPAYLADTTAEERRELEGFSEGFLGPKDIKSNRVAEYAEQVEAYRILDRAWLSSHAKQRLVQWPAAWADAMLKARQA